MRPQSMHLAASEGHLEVVRLLVEEHNADTSPVDRWGGTPLDDAIRHCREEVWAAPASDVSLPQMYVLVLLYRSGVLISPERVPWQL